MEVEATRKNRHGGQPVLIAQALNVGCCTLQHYGILTSLFPVLQNVKAVQAMDSQNRKRGEPVEYRFIHQRPELVALQIAVS